MASKIGEARPMSRSMSRELHSSNSFATRSAAQKSQEVATLFLDKDHSSSFSQRVHPSRRESEWSYATTFARGGIEPGQGLKGKYIRDPNSGVWYPDAQLEHGRFQLKPHKPAARGRLDMASLNSTSVLVSGKP